MADDGGVEGQRGPGDARHVGGALPLAVVGVVTGWCDYPVVPADVFEVDVELPFAADADLPIALQPALPAPPRVGAILLPDHGHEEGPVRLFPLAGPLRRLRAAGDQDERRASIGAERAGNPEAQRAAGALQQRLHRRRHREGVPAAATGVHRFLRQQDVVLWRRRASVGKPALLEEADGDLGSAAVGLGQTEEEPDVGLLHQRQIASFFRQHEVHRPLRLT